MCGIVAGYDTSCTLEKIKNSLSSMKPRGPDFSKIEQVNPSVFLGFNLLGISAIQTNSLIQPFLNKNKSIYACVNGEIYNHKILRSDLENKGYVFQTESDCEVVLFGLECYGKDFLSHLNGEFAIVAYFLDSNSWLCATDHVGTKPLKFFLDEDRFLIASSVLALKELSVRIGFDAASSLFAFHNACVPSGRTLFAGIHTIPPGHYLEVNEKLEAQILRYDQSVTFERQQRDGIEELIQRAVRLRIPQYLKPALALSGGIDSSLIALFLKKQEIAFSSYSIDFPNSEYSERSDIESFCKRHEIKTQVVSISDSDLIDAFSESVLNAENIVINPHSAGKLILNKFISQKGHRVCFTGDGADELFWGYEHFHTTDEFQFVRDSNFIGSQFAQILKPKFRNDLLESQLFRDFQAMNSEPTAQELYYHYWLNEYGLKILGDSQAANQSIEYRYPFVDLELITQAKTQAMSKRDNFPSKTVLRKVMEKWDPETANAPKRPFTAPLITKKWLPLFEHYVFSDRFRRLEIFDHAKLKEYVGRLGSDQLNSASRASSVLLSQILSLGILNQELCHG